MNSINWPASSVWVFIAQLGEHCSANAEATGSNPVEAPKTFFSGYFRNCLNCDSLRWSHTHFIDVLIGSDYDVVSGDVVRGDSGPVAISSMFGWILSGHASEAEARDKFSTTNLIIERSEPMSVSPFDIHSDNDELNSLQKFWDTESLGVQYATKVPQVDGDEFLSDINFDEVERRYEVGLPWKEGCFPASDEYGMCMCTEVETTALVIEEEQGTVERLQQCNRRTSQVRDHRSIARE